ncbi:MAG: hypothetical protein SFV53_01910 [Rickettsiales bacterium]|nr:hypothetical protein [Rickettsiales bacterium]
MRPKITAKNFQLQIPEGFNTATINSLKDLPDEKFSTRFDAAIGVDKVVISKNKAANAINITYRKNNETFLLTVNFTNFSVIKEHENSVVRLYKKKEGKEYNEKELERAEIGNVKAIINAALIKIKAKEQELKTKEQESEFEALAKKVEEDQDQNENQNENENVLGAVFAKVSKDVVSDQDLNEELQELEDEIQEQELEDEIDVEQPQFTITLDQAQFGYIQSINQEQNIEINGGKKYKLSSETKNSEIIYNLEYEFPTKDGNGDIVYDENGQIKTGKAKYVLTPTLNGVDGKFSIQVFLLNGERWLQRDINQENSQRISEIIGEGLSALSNQKPSAIDSTEPQINEGDLPKQQRAAKLEFTVAEVFRYREKIKSNAGGAPQGTIYYDSQLNKHVFFRVTNTADFTITSTTNEGNEVKFEVSWQTSAMANQTTFTSKPKIKNSSNQWVDANISNLRIEKLFENALNSLNKETTEFLLPRDDEIFNLFRDRRKVEKEFENGTKYKASITNGGDLFIEESLDSVGKIRYLIIDQENDENFLVKYVVEPANNKITAEILQSRLNEALIALGCRKRAKTVFASPADINSDLRAIPVSGNQSGLIPAAEAQFGVPQAIVISTRRLTPNQAPNQNQEELNEEQINGIEDLRANLAQADMISLLQRDMKKMEDTVTDYNDPKVQAFLRTLILIGSCDFSVTGASLNQENQNQESQITEKTTKASENNLPASVYLAGHKGRTYMALPSGSGDRVLSWISNGLDASKSNPIKPRAFATHSASVENGVVTEKKLNPVEAGGIGVLAGVTGNRIHHGLDIAIGGKEKKYVSLDQETIKDDGTSGHLYYNLNRSKEGDSLGIGLELTAPLKSSPFGAYSTTGAADEFTALEGEKYSVKVSSKDPAFKRCMMVNENDENLPIFTSRSGTRSDQVDQQLRRLEKLLQKSTSNRSRNEQVEIKQICTNYNIELVPDDSNQALTNFGKQLIRAGITLPNNYNGAKASLDQEKVGQILDFGLENLVGNSDEQIANPLFFQNQPNAEIKVKPADMVYWKPQASLAQYIAQEIIYKGVAASSDYQNGQKPLLRNNPHFSHETSVAIGMMYNIAENTFFADSINSTLAFITKENLELLGLDITKFSFAQLLNVLQARPGVYGNLNVDENLIRNLSLLQEVEDIAKVTRYGRAEEYQTLQNHLKSAIEEERFARFTLKQVSILEKMPADTEITIDVNGEECCFIKSLQADKTLAICQFQRDKNGLIEQKEFISFDRLLSQELSEILSPYYGPAPRQQPKASKSKEVLIAEYEKFIEADVNVKRLVAENGARIYKLGSVTASIRRIFIDGKELITAQQIVDETNQLKLYQRNLGNDVYGEILDNRGRKVGSGFEQLINDVRDALNEDETLNEILRPAAKEAKAIQIVNDFLGLKRDNNNEFYGAKKADVETIFKENPEVANVLKTFLSVNFGKFERSRNAFFINLAAITKEIGINFGDILFTIYSNKIEALNLYIEAAELGLKAARDIIANSNIFDKLNTLAKRNITFKADEKFYNLELEEENFDGAESKEEPKLTIKLTNISNNVLTEIEAIKIDENYFVFREQLEDIIGNEEANKILAAIDAANSQIIQPEELNINAVIAVAESEQAFKLNIGGVEYNFRILTGDDEYRILQVGDDGNEIAGGIKFKLTTKTALGGALEIDKIERFIGEDLVTLLRVEDDQLFAEISQAINAKNEEIEKRNEEINQRRVLLQADLEFRNAGGINLPDGFNDYNILQQFVDLSIRIEVAGVRYQIFPQLNNVGDAIIGYHLHPVDVNGRRIDGVGYKITQENNGGLQQVKINKKQLTVNGDGSIAEEAIPTILNNADEDAAFANIIAAFNTRYNRDPSLFKAEIRNKLEDNLNLESLANAAPDQNVRVRFTAADLDAVNNDINYEITKTPGIIGDQQINDEGHCIAKINNVGERELFLKVYRGGDGVLHLLNSRDQEVNDPELLHRLANLFDGIQVDNNAQPKHATQITARQAKFTERLVTLDPDTELEIGDAPNKFYLIKTVRDPLDPLAPGEITLHYYQRNAEGLVDQGSIKQIATLQPPYNQNQAALLRDGAGNLDPVVDQALTSLYIPNDIKVERNRDVIIAELNNQLDDDGTYKVVVTTQEDIQLPGDPAPIATNVYNVNGRKYNRDDVGNYFLLEQDPAHADNETRKIRRNLNGFGLIQAINDVKIQKERNFRNVGGINLPYGFNYANLAVLNRTQVRVLDDRVLGGGDLVRYQIIFGEYDFYITPVDVNGRRIFQAPNNISYEISDAPFRVRKVSFNDDGTINPVDIVANGIDDETFARIIGNFQLRLGLNAGELNNVIQQKLTDLNLESLENAAPDQNVRVRFTAADLDVVNNDVTYEITKTPGIIGDQQINDEGHYITKINNAGERELFLKVYRGGDGVLHLLDSTNQEVNNLPDLHRLANLFDGIQVADNTQPKYATQITARQAKFADLFRNINAAHPEDVEIKISDPTDPNNPKTTFYFFKEIVGGETYLLRYQKDVDKNITGNVIGIVEIDNAGNVIFLPNGVTDFTEIDDSFNRLATNYYNLPRVALDVENIKTRAQICEAAVSLVLDESKAPNAKSFKTMLNQVVSVGGSDREVYLVNAKRFFIEGNKPNRVLKLVQGEGSLANPLISEDILIPDLVQLANYIKVRRIREDIDHEVDAIKADLINQIKTAYTDYKKDGFSDKKIEKIVELFLRLRSDGNYPTEDSNIPEGIKNVLRNFSFSGIANQSLIQNFKGVQLLSLADQRNAFKEFKKSATSENKYGQFNLARCFEKGIVVAKNDEEALGHYEGAAFQGHEAALKKVIEFYEAGRGFRGADKENLKQKAKTLKALSTAAKRAIEIEVSLNSLEKERYKVAPYDAEKGFVITKMGRNGVAEEVEFMVHPSDHANKVFVADKFYNQILNNDPRLNKFEGIIQDLENKILPFESADLIKLRGQLVTDLQGADNSSADPSTKQDRAEKIADEFLNLSNSLLDDDEIEIAKYGTKGKNNFLFSQSDGVREVLENFANRTIENFADSGNAHLQNLAGQFYFEGIGVEKNAENYSKAKECFEKAAAIKLTTNIEFEDSGYAPAQYNLGLVYLNGDVNGDVNAKKFIAPKEKEAFKCFEAAKKARLPAAQSAVAVCQSKAIGTDKVGIDQVVKNLANDFLASPNDPVLRLSFASAREKRSKLEQDLVSKAKLERFAYNAYEKVAQDDKKNARAANAAGKILQRGIVDPSGEKSLAEDAKAAQNYFIQGVEANDINHSVKSLRALAELYDEGKVHIIPLKGANYATSSDKLIAESTNISADILETCAQSFSCPSQEVEVVIPQGGIFGDRKEKYKVLMCKDEKYGFSGFKIIDSTGKNGFKIFLNGEARIIENGKELPSNYTTYGLKRSSNLFAAIIDNLKENNVRQKREIITGIKSEILDKLISDLQSKLGSKEIATNVALDFLGLRTAFCKGVEFEANVGAEAVSFYYSENQKNPIAANISDKKLQEKAQTVLINFAKANIEEFKQSENPHQRNLVGVIRELFLAKVDPSPHDKTRARAPHDEYEFAREREYLPALINLVELAEKDSLSRAGNDDSLKKDAYSKSLEEYEKYAKQGYVPAVKAAANAIIKIADLDEEIIKTDPTINVQDPAKIKNAELIKDLLKAKEQGLEIRIAKYDKKSDKTTYVYYEVSDYDLQTGITVSVKGKEKSGFRINPIDDLGNPKQIGYEIGSGKALSADPIDEDLKKIIDEIAQEKLPIASKPSPVVKVSSYSKFMGTQLRR